MINPQYFGRYHLSYVKITYKYHRNLSFKVRMDYTNFKS